MNFWVIATGALILAGFSIPGNYVQSVRPSPGFLGFLFSDPLLHVYAMGVFTVVLGWSQSRRKNPGFSLKKVALYSFLYGIFIELYQAALPYRAFELEDFVWDGVGILAGLVIFLVFPGIAYRGRGRPCSRGFEREGG